MRGALFDARQRLKLNYAANRKMDGPLPWSPTLTDSTNTRAALTVGQPVPTAFYGTYSVPTGATYMGTFDGINKVLNPGEGGDSQIVPDRVVDINISVYVYASRAANVEIGVHDPSGLYTSPTPWSSTVAVPALTWTRVSASGPANIGDDPANRNYGEVYARVTPTAGAALGTDFVWATASQVTATTALEAFIDHNITDEWLDVERADPDQTGVITTRPNQGSAVDHQVAVWTDLGASPLTVPRVTQNLIFDPRATNTAKWASTFGTGGAGTETAVTGASDGPVLPDGSQVTTYMRYTVTTANTSGNPTFGVQSSSENPTTVYPIGTSVAVAIYIRPSAAVADGRARTNQSLDGGAATAINGAAGAALVAGVWTRIDTVVVSTISADYFTASAILLSHVMVAGQTYDVTCALAAPGETSVPNHIDGAIADSSEFAFDWTGTANASPSLRWRVADIYPWSVA